MGRSRAVVVALACVGLLTFATEALAQTPTWLPHEQRSTPGDVYVQSWPGALDSVAINSRGDAVIAWHRNAGFDPGTVQSAIHRAGAPPTTSPLLNVSPNDYDPNTGMGTRTGGAEPVTIDEAGNARIFYSVQGADGFKDLVFRTSPPDSSEWGPPVTIVDATSLATEVSGGINAATNASGETVLLAFQGGVTGYAGTPGSFGPPAGLGGGSVTQVAMNDAGDAVAVKLVAPVADYIVRPIYRPRGGSWALGPQLNTGANPETPVAAIGGDGTAIVLWVQSNGANKIVYYAVHPPGGPFGAAQQLSTTGIDSTVPSIAMNESGEAIVAFQEGAGNIRLLRRPPGGSFTSIGSGYVPEVPPPAAPSSVSNPRVALNDAGDSLISYHGVFLGITVIRVVRRPAGESEFAMPTTISPFSSFNAVLAINRFGDAFAGFGTGNAPTHIRSAGFDASAPQLENIELPPTQFRDVATPYSVSPVDAWSPIASTQWLFGDGTSADSASGSKTYTQNGSYTATITAADTLGFSSSTTRDVTVTDAPPDPPGDPGEATGPAELSSLALNPRAFIAEGSGRSIRAKRKGTNVSYNSTQPATTGFTVERVKLGYRARGRCVPRRPRGANRPRRCKLYVPLKGSFAHEATAGPNAFHFAGRLRGRKLKPGRYRLTAVARNAFGSSEPARAPFRVKRVRRRR